jgi:hypothetical protein
MGRLLDDDALLAAARRSTTALLATIRSGTVGDRP